jgi:hypothetical protein
VLHIAYYPSAPYAACPFNQMNKAEQDERTKFYGVYGATPRLVINGAPIPANTPYTDPAIFESGPGHTSDFAVNVLIRRTAAATGEAAITIKKVAANSLSKLLLYAVIAEDTVRFNANNGETIHYDKFNKSLTGIAPLVISSPLAAGDSVIRTFTFDIAAAWGPSRVTVILQDEEKKALQAARSAVLSPSTSIMPVSCAVLCIYPVPTKDELRFTDLAPGHHHYVISNSLGQVVQRGTVYDIAYPITLHSLQSGFYVISIDEGAQKRHGRFVKQ